jgi:adenosine deaminase
MNKRSYVDAVIEGVRSVSSVDVDFIPKTGDSKIPNNDKCNGNSRKKIIVRLILSIDRRETTEAAMETVS